MPVNAPQRNSFYHETATLAKRRGDAPDVTVSSTTQRSQPVPAGLAITRCSADSQPPVPRLLANCGL